VRRLLAAAAALVVLAGCGGGSPSPRASTSATGSPTPALSAGAKKIRDLTAASKRACPCRLELSVAGYGQGDDAYGLQLTGTYVAATAVSSFTTRDKDGVPWWIANGRAYARIGALAGLHKPWVELDFSRFSGIPKTTIESALLADPTLFFAIAQGVTGEPYLRLDGAQQEYDVEIDRAAAITAAGARGDVLDQVLPKTTILGKISVRGGRIKAVSFDGEVQANGSTPHGGMIVWEYGVTTKLGTPPAPSDVTVVDVQRLPR
jgi:hypothetical protein